jgi:hypothetical protein
MIVNGGSHTSEAANAAIRDRETMSDSDAVTLADIRELLKAVKEFRDEQREFGKLVDELVATCTLVLFCSMQHSSGILPPTLPNHSDRCNSKSEDKKSFTDTIKCGGEVSRVEIQCAQLSSCPQGEPEMCSDKCVVDQSLLSHACEKTYDLSITHAEIVDAKIICHEDVGVSDDCREKSLEDFVMTGVSIYSGMDIMAIQRVHYHHVMLSMHLLQRWIDTLLLLQVIDVAFVVSGFEKSNFAREGIGPSSVYM